MGQNKSQFQEYKRDQKLRQNSDKIHGLAKVLALTSKHEKLQSHVGWANQQQNKQSMKMLKNIFGQLDPSVIHQRGTDCGQVELSLKYNQSKSLLLVRIERCVNLRSRDLRSKACNPYAKISLVPDIEEQGVKHTETSPLTCNPVYGELFAFKLSPDSIQTGHIFVEVWDNDINDRDEFLGQTLVSLCDLRLEDNITHTAKASLEIKSDLHVCGELNISLSYEEILGEEEAGPKLSITVHGATELKQRPDNQSADACVKVTIPGTLFSFTTQVLTATSSPVWDETFECTIPRRDFNRRFILFQVIDKSEEMERPLGQVVVPLADYNPDKAFHDTYSLTDLTNSDLLQEKLAQDPATQELRGALQAHAMVANPSFIFQKLEGNKVITLTARKARSQARVSVQDGIPVY